MSHIDINMNYQFNSIYRTIDELNIQVNHLRTIINSHHYDPLNYTDPLYNPFTPRSNPFANPLDLPPIPPIPPLRRREPIPPRYPRPPNTNRTSRREMNTDPITIDARERSNTSTNYNTSNWTEIPYRPYTTPTPTPNPYRTNPDQNQDQDQYHNPIRPNTMDTLMRPQMFEVVLNRTINISDENSENNILVTHKMVNQNSELKMYELEEGQTNSVCSICRDEISHGDIVRSLSNCIHMFHQTCIDKWFEDKNTCPECRQTLVPETVNTENNDRLNPTDRQNNIDSLRELLQSLRDRYNLPTSSV